MERIENTLSKLVDLDRWLIDRHFPLSNRTIDPLSIPWAPMVAAHWPDVRRELDALLDSGIQMPDINEVMGEELGAEGPWTTYILYSFGSWIEANAARCPATAAVIRDIPDLEIAGFTVLDAGTHIPLHRGPFRALRYQLGVRVPEPIGACRLQVADEARYVFFVQTRWPLTGWEGITHRAIHRVLALAARSVPAKAAELDHALNGWR